MSAPYYVLRAENFVLILKGVSHKHAQYSLNKYGIGHRCTSAAQSLRQAQKIATMHVAEVAPWKKPPENLQPNTIIMIRDLERSNTWKRPGNTYGAKE